MRVKVTILDDGKVRLELGYYKKHIILNDIEELIQFSSDLNNEISRIFNPRSPKRKTSIVNNDK